MSPFQVITHYLCQQLAPGTAAVVSGRRGCGKTQIMKQVGASFDGAVLYIVALPDQDLLVIDSRGSCGFFAGEQISASQIWTWFLTRKSSADISWMLVIDNAHLLKSLTTIVDTFYQLAETGESSLSLLLVGQPFSLRKRRLRAMCPVWVDVPGGIVPSDEAGALQPALQHILARSSNPLRLFTVLCRSIQDMESSEEVRNVLFRLVPSRWKVCVLGIGYALLAGSFGWMMTTVLPLHLPVPWAEKKSVVMDLPLAKITDRPAGERSGMQGLISTWGYDVPLEMAWCDRIEIASLRCESATGQLTDMVNQGLPWMARLKVEDKDLWGVVMRVGEDTLDVLVNQEIWSVRRAWFERVWQGQYTVIRKTTPEGDDRVTAKSGSEQIVWLDNALSRALNVPTTQATNWKPMLTEKVKLFQNQQKIPADGAAGKMTLIRLFQALGESPRLQVGEDLKRKNP